MTTFTKTIGGTDVTFTVAGTLVTATPEGGKEVSFEGGRAKFPVADGEASASAKFVGRKLYVTFGTVGYANKFDVEIPQAAQAA